MFYHSLLSCWNHGNAHFLRGIAAELAARGHEVVVYEPRDGWSRANLEQEVRSRQSKGTTPTEWRTFAESYPELAGMGAFYDDAKTLDLDAALDGVDLVLVHEWNDHALVARIGEHRKRGGAYRLLFHDTHHRAVTAPKDIAAYDLSGYDGVLAFGQVLRDLYLQNRWTGRAWTWHEAADTRVFHPMSDKETGAEGDLVWIGNWGDDERTAELREFLLEPVKALGLKARIYGVRYPDQALAALRDAGVSYGGWVPNYEAPRVFARYAMTVHVPRRPYVRALPGIPTIRVFEALACGIPLVSAPWEDSENLFTPGRDFLTARDGAQMREHLTALREDEIFARQVAARGRETVLARHTCAHRADELLGIYEELREEAR
jgi:spore maturation protein CgeB